MTLRYIHPQIVQNIYPDVCMYMYVHVCNKVRRDIVHFPFNSTPPCLHTVHLPFSPLHRLSLSLSPSPSPSPPPLPPPSTSPSPTPTPSPSLPLPLPLALPLSTPYPLLPPPSPLPLYLSLSLSPASILCNHCISVKLSSTFILTPESLELLYSSHCVG